MEQNSTNLGDENNAPENSNEKQSNEKQSNEGKSSGANVDNNQSYNQSYNQNNNQYYNPKDYYNTKNYEHNIIKPKSVFWGTLFFLVGLVILLSNLHIDLAIYNPKIFDYWPLLLILYGVSFFKLPLLFRQINSAIGAVFVMLLILNMFNADYNWVNVVKKSKFIKINHNIDDDVDGGKYSEYKDVKKILLDTSYIKSHFSMNAGAGDFKLFSSNNEYLIEVESNTESDYGKLYTSLDTNNKKYDIIYKTNTDGNQIDDEDFDRQVDFTLSEKCLWTIESNIGAGEFDFDLTKINFDSLEINAGAAEIKIKIGENIQKSHLNINTGATDIKIKIPKNIGCQIITKTALTENNFKNFTRIKDDLYQNQSFNNSIKKLYITIDGGISSYNVETY